ncbi:MAG TPA: hypothetical protein VKS60_00495 [Stellaceae bacterium]|nr:hypothetical protein [Stellaceae bacterium]
MKHAGPETLERLAPLLAAVRARSELVERRPGVFYRKSRAFLHFHEDPEGLFADIRPGDEWLRVNVTETAHRAEFEEILARAFD